jgi:CBS domain-containing protein
MKVAALYNPLVVSAQTWETLDEVSTRMMVNEVSCAPVFEGARLAGIITERDLVRAMANGVMPAETTAVDYMTEAPTVVTPKDDAREAALIMLQHGIRHLPVLVEDRLLGVISIRDVLQDSFWDTSTTS